MYPMRDLHRLVENFRMQASRLAVSDTRSLAAEPGRIPDQKWIIAFAARLAYPPSTEWNSVSGPDSGWMSIATDIIESPPRAIRKVEQGYGTTGKVALVCGFREQRHNITPQVHVCTFESHAFHAHSNRIESTPTDTSKKNRR